MSRTTIVINVLDPDRLRVHDRTFRLPPGEDDPFRYAHDLRALFDRLIDGSEARCKALELQIAQMSVLPPRAHLEGLLDQNVRAA